MVVVELVVVVVVELVGYVVGSGQCRGFAGLACCK